MDDGDQKYSGKKKTYNKIGLTSGHFDRMSREDNFQDYEFYEIELRDLWWFSNLEKLPKYEDGTKSWELMGEKKTCRVTKKSTYRHFKDLSFVKSNSCSTSW